jgi:hypothetical protein
MSPALPHAKMAAFIARIPATLAHISFLLAMAMEYAILNVATDQTKNRPYVLICSFI